MSKFIDPKEQKKNREVEAKLQNNSIINELKQTKAAKEMTKEPNKTERKKSHLQIIKEEHPQERIQIASNGQWKIEKYNLEKRCWEGYEPTPGKKAYEKGSCQPAKKSDDLEVAPEDSNNKKTYKENVEGK